MIWGAARDSRLEWHRARPWLPVRLLDGRWAWGESVERISFFAKEIPVSAPNNVSLVGPTWCYRLVENG